MSSPDEAGKDQLTASFRPLPALNLGWVDALIVIGSPVRGLRPVDALRFDTEKVPNPTMRTSSPFFKAPPITSKTASTALLASPLLSPAVSATALISSCVFLVLETPVWSASHDR